MSERLFERLSEVPAAQLLPERLTSDGARLPQRLTAIAVEELDEHMWLVLLAADEVTYSCPVVEVDGRLRRARPGDGAASKLIERLGVEPSTGHTFEWRSFHDEQVDRGEQAMGVDQTHDSVVVGSAGVVKWMVRAEPSPAPELVAHLAANGFTAMPTPWGFVSTQHAAQTLVLVSVAQFLPEAKDGWEWMVDDVTAHARGRTGLADALAPVGDIGRIVADMHVASATPSNVLPAPTSEVAGSVVQQWNATARGLLADAVTEVSGDEGERLRAVAPQIESALEHLREVERTPTLHIHGDLHVGQVLRWVGGYAINDFDGNPVLPPSDRFGPQPAARDVAGMLQALDHVGRIVRKRREGIDHQKVVDWIHQAQDEFLGAYRNGLAAASMSYLLDERLLQPFRVEQELREFLYAERHLPRWRYVPDAALADLLA